MYLSRAISAQLNRGLAALGLEVRRVQKTPTSIGFSDMEPWVRQIVERVSPFTMTSPERISALCHAVRYVARAGIPGDVVECGVWRGGSIMAAALTLLAERDIRRLHLFDTFEGMPPPMDVDRRVGSEESAAAMLENSDRSSFVWAYSAIDEVKRNIASTGYPPERVRYIRGRVEETIPKDAPDRIAILRLDTDWYESTKHELVHLYPLLAVGGVLIIDDYGFWDGARKATDEYVSSNPSIFLQRIDSDGRLAIKVSEVARLAVPGISRADTVTGPAASSPIGAPIT